jgi:hypothetical protein
MKPEDVTDRSSLEAFLAGDWMHVSRAIAFRAALRNLPNIPTYKSTALASEALVIFRALLITSLKLDDYYQNIAGAVEAALGDIGHPKFEQSDQLYGSARASAAAALASVVLNDAPEFWAAKAVSHNVGFYGDGVWNFVRAELHILQSLNIETSVAEAGQVMLNRPIWPFGRDIYWESLWTKVPPKLNRIDSNFAVWIDWYERRIRGERAAFDIPGDKYRKEDKKILRRLAEATDEDFWGKGHEYVNATLKGWLDEARERVRPSEVHALQAMNISTGPPEVGSATLGIVEAQLELSPPPPQDPSAITYGINEQGKLDRLPNSDQVHLRDVPDQRRAYTDLRDTAAELLGEGQRLGYRLALALERFLHSLSDHFEDAEAYLVWRDANALRRLHRAHREASKSLEPDEAKLEPVIAEGLGGLLDLYNNFAFADDGLRAKDEARISPQERASAEAEAKAASPLVEAILATPEIATSDALDDIAADAEGTDLPADDPYASQVLDQANRTKRNWIAGLLSGARKAVDNPKAVGFRFTKGIVQGIGGLAAAGLVTHQEVILHFFATNAAILSHYVAIAYPAYPQLPELIAQAKHLWQWLKGKT